MGGIGRYNASGQVLNTGSAGTFSLVLDLASTPTPTGAVAIMAGDTWNFQCWYRDVRTHLSALQSASFSLTVEGGNLAAFGRRILESSTSASSAGSPDFGLLAILEFPDAETAGASRKTLLAQLGSEATLAPNGFECEQLGKRVFLRLGKLDTNPESSDGGPTLAQRWGVLGAALSHRQGADILVQAFSADGDALLEIVEVPEAKPFGKLLPDLRKRYHEHGIWKIGFYLDAFDELHTHMTKAGAKFYGSIVPLPSGRRLFVALDPDGNRVQLYEILDTDK